MTETTGSDFSSEPEDLIYDEANFLYQTLLEDPSESRLSIEKVDELKDLLAERVQLKLELVYDSLQHQIDCVHAETSETCQEQRAIVRKIFEKRGNCSVTVDHSLLDHVGFLSDAATNDINQWSGILPGLAQDVRLNLHIPLVLREYRKRTETFMRQVVNIREQLATIIDDGLYVLCRLSPSQVPVEFLRKFCDGLNSYNLLVDSLKIFSENYMHNFSGISFPAHPQTINLKRLLEEMAKHQGLFVAELVCQMLEGHIDMVIKNLDKNSDKETMRHNPFDLQHSPNKNEASFPNYVHHNGPRIKRRAVRADPTSDYYSSSASSTRTEEKLPPIKTARLNFRLHHQMQDLYTGFLEQRYTVFISLLDCAGKYRSLYEAKKVHKQKTVIWLDDVVQKQRKKMWKYFVGELWEQFQSSFTDKLMLGFGSTPSMLQCSRAVVEEVITIVKDALDAVPLPDALISSKQALVSLSNIYESKLISAGLLSFLVSAQKDKCHPQKTAKSFGTETGLHLNNLMPIAPKGTDLQRTLVQVGVWWTKTKGVQLLAAFKIDSYIAVRFGDSVWCRIAKISQSKAFDQQDKYFKQTFGRTTNQCLFEAIPSSKSFMSNTKEVSDHTIYLVTTVLEPIFEAAKHIPTTQRLPLLEFTVYTFLSSWVEYMIVKPIKLNETCAKTLTEDFSFVREWIRNSEYLNGEERQSLSDLPIFDYLASGTSILLDPGSTSSKIATARFHRKNRINPTESTRTVCDAGTIAEISGEKESVELSVINDLKQLPSLQEWRKMRKGFSLGIPCFSACKHL